MANNYHITFTLRVNICYVASKILVFQPIFRIN
jgi:hypothetical protein